MLDQHHLAVAPAARVVAPAASARLPIVDALLHDFGSASALVARQLALPLTSAFGLPVLVAMLVLAGIVMLPLRLWLLARLSATLRRAVPETRLTVMAKAVGTVLISTVLLIIAGRIVLGAFTLTLRLLPETAILLHALAMAMGVTGIGLGLGRALRSPEDKAWRPVELPVGLGSAIGFYCVAAALTLGLTNVIDQTARVVHATPATWSISQALIMLIETGLLARLLVLAGEARTREIESATSDHHRPAVPAVFGMTALVWGALALACVTWLLGYTRFAMLVLQELLWSGMVLSVAWLLTAFLDALLGQVFDADWAVGRFATAVVGVQRARVRQIALLGSAVLSVIVWLFAIGLMAAPLHGDRAVVVAQIRPVMLVNAFQSLHLSPHTIGTAVLVLVVGITLTRIARGWLENRFLPSTSLDIGVRTSLVTGLTYVGMLIAILAATSMMGLQLEKITLIASALSVGIGFGLQSIIQNFVSGVILLVERPVKVGDWIAVSGAEGTIRRIRVRATELATADGGVAIVPNSSFISANVANRADTLMACRIDLSLTVSGPPSATAARDAVLDLVRHCPLIRAEPAPQIHLATLGDAQWVFALKAYAGADTTPVHARSELLFALGTRTEGANLKITST